VIPAWQGPEDAESHGQALDAAAGTISSPISHFSKRVVLTENQITALLKQTSALGTPISVPIDLTKCWRCKTRIPGSISQIIIHSTNDNYGTRFAGLLAWIHRTIGITSGENKEAYFATYYINRDGKIAQLVQDMIQTAHVGVGDINTKAIGIELFDGEPSLSHWSLSPTARSQY
jgi:hypothetical protein